jgi:acetyltransferase-like isoleucine patch superfamily enzyme
MLERVRTIARRSSNRLLHLLARFLPGGKRVRPFLHRLRGVQIGKGVFIGDEVYLENDYPEDIELREGALIGLRSTIVAHTRSRGRVVIGKNAVIGAGCLITCQPGKTLEIGEGAVVGAGSVVANSIPPFTFCGSPRVRALATITVPFALDKSYEEFIRGLRPLQKQGARPSLPNRDDTSAELKATGIMGRGKK